jgi:Leucine-rich repeat (LRR) protein
MHANERTNERTKLEMTDSAAVSLFSTARGKSIKPAVAESDHRRAVADGLRSSVCSPLFSRANGDPISTPSVRDYNADHQRRLELAKGAKQARISMANIEKKLFGCVDCSGQSNPSDHTEAAGSQSAHHHETQEPDRKRRFPSKSMHVPLEMAQEIGSFLSHQDLDACMTQLCVKGVMFVSTPVAHERTTELSTATVNLDAVIKSTRFSIWDRKSKNETEVAQMIVGRIEVFLARRPHVNRLFLFVNEGAFQHRQGANVSIYAHVECHFHPIVPRDQQGNIESKITARWKVRTRTLGAGFAFRLLHTLEICNVGSFGYSGIGLDLLARCVYLHTLDLNNTRVDDVSALASCKLLHTLVLYRTPVTDVSALASCKLLQYLNLSCTRVSEVSALASCQLLRTLYINRTEATADGSVTDVSALASCRLLHTLDLGYNGVSDISALASCVSLHFVHLSATQVSDVSALQQCRSLCTLNLCDTQVIDVSTLASCESLQTLNLNGTKVSDVSALVSCVSLQYVYLSSTQVREVCTFASCPLLHTLVLCRTPVIDVSELVACRSLHTLDVSYTQVRDVCVLASCQSLHTLNVTRTQVCDVLALRSCPSLREVICRVCAPSGYDELLNVTQKRHQGGT